uniref:Protein kinase domain-containing protein n=1 Tax=Oryza brachyantha TaxID=4533 RepID=J3N3H9_ORYBR
MDRLMLAPAVAVVALVVFASAWVPVAAADPQATLLNLGCSQYNATPAAAFLAALNATFAGSGATSRPAVGPHPFAHAYGWKSSQKGAVIGGILGGMAFLFLLGLLAFLWTWRSTKLLKPRRGDILGATELQGPTSVYYQDLKAATNNFSEKSKLGEGGFGDVFKGLLQNGKTVAVKGLTVMETSRAKADFESEVKLISNVHHRNLVWLLGCSSKGSQCLLVYEYMANGSLDKFLFGEKRGTLNWKQRFNIIVGMARGIAYLHQEFHVCIIHRDIKSSNVLLDDEFQPKVADFGLARLLPDDHSHLSTKFAGTLGYTAPEYAIHGQLSEKAWKLYENNNLIELVDKSLDPEEYNPEQVVEFFLRLNVPEVSVSEIGAEMMESKLFKKYDKGAYRICFCSRSILISHTDLTVSDNVDSRRLFLMISSSCSTECHMKMDRIFLQEKRLNIRVKHANDRFSNIKYPDKVWLKTIKNSCCYAHQKTGIVFLLSLYLWCTVTLYAHYGRGEKGITLCWHENVIAMILEDEWTSFYIREMQQPSNFSKTVSALVVKLYLMDSSHTIRGHPPWHGWWPIIFSEPGTLCTVLHNSNCAKDLVSRAEPQRPNWRSVVKSNRRSHGDWLSLKDY